MGTLKLISPYLVALWWLILGQIVMPAVASIVTVDANDRRPISPYIYGVNLPDWGHMRIKFPLARQGGNRMTAYNWENNASNAGNDWHNQNDSFLGESDEPGYTVRHFLEETQKHGAAAIITVQTIGHVAADKSPPGDVNITPHYLNVRFIPSYARKPGGHYAYPPDIHDHAVFEDEQVWWIEGTKSSATPVWYMLDNEPDLWASTHSRIELKKPGYADIIANNIEYAEAIKDVAPKSLVFGPASYGWSGFLTFQDAADAGGRNFLNSYLEAMKAAETKQHRRILDALDIHWYPEATGGGVRITEDAGDNAALDAARIQAPRSLWDPSYVEESWIAHSLGEKPLRLLPRILDQIEAHYKGTRLSISEYNFGGGTHPSGLVAQADVLGIFGRYGIFAACNWGIGVQDKAMLGGFRAYLDYDMHGSKFGPIGLGVTGETANNNSVYAAIDSMEAKNMTVVAINKTAEDQPLCLAFKNFIPKAARAYTREEGAFDKPVTNSPAFTSTGLNFSMPPFSVTTLAVER